jgi:hypothetical protein
MAIIAGRQAGASLDPNCLKPSQTMQTTLSPLASTVDLSGMPFAAVASRPTDPI